MLILFSQLPSLTISPVSLWSPPIKIIFSLIWTDVCHILPWLKRDWEEARLLVLTSSLRSESIPLVHFAKRCKSPCPTLRRRPVGDHCPQQRGCGGISLGKRIKGWEGWRGYIQEMEGSCRWLGTFRCLFQIQVRQWWRVLQWEMKYK